MMSRLAFFALAVAQAGCGGGWHRQPLPSPLSPAARPPAERTLRAGFGRADITPPPGVGLAGNGPEGRRSTGHRFRLQARALLLEDWRGERIALVVADLPLMSPMLHRLVAARVVVETGVGADRLVLSATHTHSGPGHYFAERQYNDNAARDGGYDPAVVDFLVERIARAIGQAHRDLAPARAAWGTQSVGGFTRNRSHEGYCRNPPEDRVPCPGEPNALTDAPDRAAIDSAWVLLRVDRVEGTGSRPLGAYSVFAIHGTANPAITTLLDGDIQAVVERGLERRIDDANGTSGGFTPSAFHLFANGNEGDMTPLRPPATQCPVPKLRPPEFDGPRGPAVPWRWVDAAKGALDRCFGAARARIDQLGEVMADSVWRHFQRLAPALRSDLTIARNFTTIDLPGREGLCPHGVVGAATAAGASDVPTRIAGWKLWGVVPLGFEQGGSAVRDPPRGCQAEKQILLGGLQRLVITGKHGFPARAQLSVIRIGQMMLGTVPAEPTITAGRRFREAILTAADPDGTRELAAVIVSHANGFMNYLTTAPEYAAQAYEGASTLYGPQTVEVFARELHRLATPLGRVGEPSPPVEVGPLVAFPGRPSAVMARPTDGPPLVGSPIIVGHRCVRPALLEVTWVDEPPGRLIPADGQLLAIDEQGPQGWREIAWDDQTDVTVAAVGPVKGEGFLWRVTLARATAGPALRLRILPRGVHQGAESTPIGRCGPPMGPD